MPKHFLSVDYFASLEAVDELCELARKLEPVANRECRSTLLEGALLGTLFFEPSTRTRVSFTSAFSLLGGSVIDMGDKQSSSVVKGESLDDMSRIMSSYVDILVVRHPEEAALKTFAETSRVPLINAGNGIGEHPSQALLDVYTLLKENQCARLADLKGLSIALVGDLKHGRTVHSLTKMLSLVGNIHFKFVAPPGLEMPSSLIELLQNRQNTVTQTADLVAGVAATDVIYMTRIQEERFDPPALFQQYVGKYAIDRAFYEQYCLSQPILMHPLPRDSRLKNPELNADLNDHPKLAIFRQAWNGLPTRMALFCQLLVGASLAGAQYRAL